MGNWVDIDAVINARFRKPHYIRLVINPGNEGANRRPRLSSEL